MLIYFCARDKKKWKGSICKTDIQLSFAAECVKWELKLQCLRKFYLLGKTNEPPPPIPPPLQPGFVEVYICIFIAFASIQSIDSITDESMNLNISLKCDNGDRKLQRCTRINGISFTLLCKFNSAKTFLLAQHSCLIFFLVVRPTWTREYGARGRRYELVKIV